MGKLLYIQASPRAERSKSIAVANAFVEAYKQKNPSDEIIILSLFDDWLSEFDRPAVEAKYVILHGKTHSEEQLRTWKAVEKVINQFASADKYLLATPMWNFNIPYRLKQYIDILVQPGYTFSYSDEAGYKGLVVGKPLAVIYARGGEYSAGTGGEALDLQTKYIEQIFRFIGFENIIPIIVEPTLAGGEELCKLKLKEAIEQAKAIAVDF
ncbi:MAG: FMN-dependent NADH-azoreductase [Planctomycetota bacterium]|jgi:FMN-dependent NADH-azoreductase